MAKVLVVGSSVVDLTFYAKRIPVVGETVTGRFAQGLGGKGFNQAVGCALAGTSTAFISALGNDVYAAPFEARLRELNIASALETIPDESTGAATISVDETGRNSIIVALGANSRLSPAFLVRNEKMFADADVLLMQFETNLEVIDCALRMVRDKNPRAVTILNPAPALPKIPSSIMKNLSFLTPNETELATLTGCPVNTIEEVHAACAKVQFDGAVLATLGERGCFYYKKTGTSVETEALPAFSVKAIDTAGAGDAFNGAFAAGLLQNSGNWEKAAVFASAAAALSVTRPGTSASMAGAEEISRFLTNQRR